MFDAAAFEDSHEELNFFPFCLWKGSYMFYKQGESNVLQESKLFSKENYRRSFHFRVDWR